MNSSLVPAVEERLKFYVYLYIDPRNDTVFYVGKGRGNRIFDHLNDTSESEKRRVIRELYAAGLKPKLEVLVHGLENEMDALRIEAAVIDLLGRHNLTNQVRGWGSQIVGRASLEELNALYGAAPVQIDDPVLLIRINQLYRYGMSALELYEATRGIWLLGERRESARYALAIFRGVVREVYQIDTWHRAGSTSYLTRSRADIENPIRWEFTGTVADTGVRHKYVNGNVKVYFPEASQNPIRYVNC